jgi:hypothetical protein
VQTEQFTDRQREPEIAETGFAVERPGDVDAVCRPAALGERAAHTHAGGSAPAGIDAERCITRPDAARIDEDGATDIEHIGEWPADVEAILERCNETATARHALMVVAAQCRGSAEIQLVWCAGVPAAEERSAQEERLARECRRLEIGEELVLEVEVVPLRSIARRTQVTACIRAAASDQQEVAHLESGIESERRVEVVVRLERWHGTADAEYGFRSQAHILLAAHAVQAAPLSPPHVTMADQSEDADVVEILTLRTHGLGE